MDAITAMVSLCNCVTYVLRLEHNTYYVGRSKSLHHRLTQHFSNEGAKWTKMFKPIEVVEVLKDDVEEEITLRYMKTYGIEAVRGYSWCQPILSKYGKSNIVAKMKILYPNFIPVI